MPCTASFVGNIYKKKQELELTIFDEDLLICDIKYTLDKKIGDKMYIQHDNEDENSGDEASSSDRDEDTSDSGKRTFISPSTVEAIMNSMPTFHVGARSKNQKNTRIIV